MVRSRKNKKYLRATRDLPDAIPEDREPSIEDGETHSLLASPTLDMDSNV